MIRYDRGTGSVLVRCAACKMTIGVHFSIEAARRIGDKHRANVHPRQATFAASKRRARSTTTVEL